MLKKTASMVLFSVEFIIIFDSVALKIGFADFMDRAFGSEVKC